MTNYQATLKEISEKPYAALRREVYPQNFPYEIPPLIGVLLNLLEKQNIKTNGSCFFRYLSCANDGQMVMEVGFPIVKYDSNSDLKSDKNSESIEFSSLPSGKYLSVIHTGDFKNLIEAHIYLENYSKSNNLSLDEIHTDTRVEWKCRAEVYLTDPDVTPVEDRKTEVLFLLKENLSSL